MRRDRSAPPSELLSAYVDGVAELGADERREIEARLAEDPALRAEAEEARALIGALRELPRGAGAAGEPACEPDWAGLERAILDAVGPEMPRPWWRRLGLRWAAPMAALAAGAAILALAVRAPTLELGPALEAMHRTEPAAAAPEAPDGEPAAGDTMALWLDGEGVEIEVLADELDALEDVPWEGEHHLEDLLPPSDLAWVDDLAGEELERAEALLEGEALLRGGALRDGGLLDRERRDRERPAPRKPS